MTEPLLTKLYDGGWAADGILLHGGVFKWRLRVRLLKPQSGWVHSMVFRPLFGRETLEDVVRLFGELADSLHRIEVAGQAEIAAICAAHGVRADQAGAGPAP